MRGQLLALKPCFLPALGNHVAAHYEYVKLRTAHFCPPPSPRQIGSGAEKFPYSMTFHRNVRSFGANNQGKGWEKQVLDSQPV